MYARSTTLTGTLALAVLGLSGQSLAATTTQAIAGSQSAQENGCVDAIGIFTANDCSYNGKNRWIGGVDSYDPDPVALGWGQADTPAVVDGYLVDRPDRTWIGPLANQMYYENGDSPLTNGTSPAVGDNKIALGLSGQLTIDDNNTANGDDDLISGEIVIAAGTRNVLTGQGDNTRVEESWDSLTQTLAPTTVDSATPNGQGGFDYVIASRGMPDVLQADGSKNTQAYPSEVASSPIETPVAVSGWVAPESQGRSVANFECEPESPTDILVTWNNRRNRLRFGSPLGADCADPSSNNVGVTTTGEFTGYSCVDNDGVSNCRINGAILGTPGNFFTPPGDPGYQNLLIAVSTDAGGHIVSSFAFYTHQFEVLQALFGFDTPYEAWDGGTLTMAGLVQDGSLRVHPSGGSPDVNVKSNGKIPVVLYSNDNLDATQVTNVAFGPGGATPAHGSGHASDENGDGLDDLVIHVSQKAAGLACGDTTVTLTGETGDGYPISATSPVNVVGCK
ncbi:MAG: hypothetical protein ACR2P6_01525 [Gammaproteobacteria bacterium]